MNPALKSKHGVVVYERLGCWSRLLRRRLPTFIDVHWIEWPIDDASDGPRLKSQSEPRVAVFIVDSTSCHQMLRFLRLRSAFSHDSLVIVATRTEADGPALGYLQAAGALVVDLQSVVGDEGVVEMIVRFCRPSRVSTLSLEQRIWKNLPWPESEFGG